MAGPLVISLGAHCFHRYYLLIVSSLRFLTSQLTTATNMRFVKTFYGVEQSQCLSLLQNFCVYFDKFTGLGFFRYLAFLQHTFWHV
jgi:hypothetical protein